MPLNGLSSVSSEWLVLPSLINLIVDLSNLYPPYIISPSYNNSICVINIERSRNDAEVTSKFNHVKVQTHQTLMMFPEIRLPAVVVRRSET